MAYASPNITMDQWTSGQKTDIDIFEDQLQGWLFDQARHLTVGAKSQHAGPAILALLCPYFEVFRSYQTGVPSEKKSVMFLKQALQAVFPDLSLDVIKAFAEEVRHGFAHEAVFRKVIIHHGIQGVPGLGKTAEGLLAVDPWWLLGKVEQHFHEYVADLRRGDPEKLDDFKAFMTFRMSGKVDTRKLKALMDLEKKAKK
jgi:hypothetical protein